MSARGGWGALVLAGFVAGCSAPAEVAQAPAAAIGQTSMKDPAPASPGSRDRPAPAEYVQSVLDHRAEKDRFFRAGKKSPAPAKLKATMPPLDYFPVDPSWRMTLPVVRYDHPETITLLTSSGEKRPYWKLGRIAIERDGVRSEVQIYRAVETKREEDSVWIPFVDGAAGRDTYPAGRYLDAEILADGRLLVDFNLAYNPYCAYGWEGFSCPLTPRENRLPFAIRAGEKGFHR